MKKILLLSVLMFNIFNISFSQVNTNVSVETNILVEDKSVEAVNAYWTQKRLSEAINAIQKARVERISRWVDKPFS